MTLKIDVIKTALVSVKDFILSHKKTALAIAIGLVIGVSFMTGYVKGCNGGASCQQADNEK